ncbi:MAG: sn-glycerol-3-phosphate import ATP-binding protein UgpC [Comamonas sp.]
MASISLRNVRKRYGHGAAAVPVIHGVDAEIADGEFIVIVGPSGCGKSTLLRMVAGLEEVSEGEIAIGARVVNDLEPAARDIAMVFQNYALYPHMSVFDNMAYGLKIAKQPKAEIQARVDKAARILELGHLLDRKPRQLSGGQRQRVAMGRAIVRQPQVFLFDEPLSNLDAKLRVQTRLEIQKLHRELGITALFVTHDQVEAMTLAQRMIVMNGGRVEQFGTPEAVYTRPASTFVASFIGSPPMNLVAGHASGGRFEAGGQALALPAGVQPPAASPVTLGVRPEHLRVLAPHEPADAAWPLTVEMVEILGAEHLIYGKLGTDAGEGAAALVVRTDESVPLPAIGSTLRLVPRADRLHWFDAASGQRLG